MNNYYGKYKIAYPFDSNSAAKLISADNIIGDIYKVTIDRKDDSHLAYVTNRFKQTPAYFDEETSRELAIAKAKDMNIYAILSIVGFSESENKSQYWAEFAIIGFPKSKKDCFDSFVLNLASSIKNGKRLNIELSDNDFEKVLKTNGDYLPTTKFPFPDKRQGTVFLKKSISLKEKLIEQARNKNIGCSIVGWIFLLLIITGLLYLGKLIIGL